MLKRFKILAEYNYYYLTISDNGYKECFNKYQYKPTNDGYILKKEYDYKGGIPTPPEHVNRRFNLNKRRKKYD